MQPIRATGFIYNLLHSPLATLFPRVARFFRNPPVPEPAPLSPDCWYLLEHGFGGPCYAFRCAPGHVPLALDLIADHGLSDVCRMALGEAIRRRPDQPAMYGEFWTLSRLKPEGE